MAAIAAAGTPAIDLVVVNLYPFRETVAKPNVRLEDAIENIDIGGPTMVRAAAKNYTGVAIVTDPGDYACIVDELKSKGGALSLATRFALAKKAFAHTAAYDGAISNWLTSLDAQNRPGLFPIGSIFSSSGCRKCAMARIRTGRGVLPRPRPGRGQPRALRATPGQGALIQQHRRADAAWSALKTFAEPACVIIKHATRAASRRPHRHSRPTGWRSRQTRPRPSAASSRSTARSMGRLQRRSRSSSSRS